MQLLEFIAPGRMRTGTHSSPGLPREAFMALLRKERARSDRTDERVSLLVLDPGGRSLPTACLDALAGPRARSLRCTDEVGWIDARRLGLLLPGTPHEGAQRLAELLSAADRSGLLARCTWKVYTHPQAWPTQHEDHPSDRQNGYDHNGYDHRNGRAALKVNGKSHAALDHGSRSEPAACVAGQPASPLSELFVVELPLWKRLFDILGSLLLLVLAAPVMLLAALVVKLTSPGPVLYTQMRAGMRGRPFRFYKFRTMCVDADKMKEKLLALNEQTGPVFKMTRDPRVTCAGRILRKTSLDELPQLWNVLRGDMSLVGPRPPITHELAGYAPWHSRRLEALGGLTCIWQVSGRNQVLFDDWMRMDLRYIEKRSLLGDLKLLAKTFPAVLVRRGAS